MNILLFPHGLGDLVQALPSFHAYARKISAPLTVGVLRRLRGAQELLRMQPYVERVIELPDPWNDFKPFNTWIGYHEGMRAIEDAHPTGRLIWTRTPVDPLSPDVCKSRRIATELGVEWSPTSTVSLPHAPHDITRGHYVVTHAHSGNPIKDVPPYVLPEIAQRILGRDLPARHVPISCDDGSPMPMRWQLQTIARSRLFVGVDSGPAHLASALAVPAVWVFTETTVQQAFPWWRPNARAFVAGHRANELRESWLAWSSANANLVPQPLHDVEIL